MPINVGSFEVRWISRSDMVVICGIKGCICTQFCLHGNIRIINKTRLVLFMLLNFLMNFLHFIQAQ